MKNCNIIEKIKILLFVFEKFNPNINTNNLTIYRNSYNELKYFNNFDKQLKIKSKIKIEKFTNGYVIKH